MWITHSYAYCCWAMRSRWYKPTIISTTMWEEQKDEVHWYLIKTGFQAPKFQLVFLLSICSMLVLNVCFWKLYLLFLYHASYRYLKTVNFFLLRSIFFFVCLFNAESKRWFQMYAHFCPIWKKTCVSQPWNKQNWKQGSSIPFDGYSNSHDKIFVLAICLVCGWCVCLFDFFLSNNIHVYKAIQTNFLIHSKITYRNERLCSHMWNFEAHSFDEKILKLATTKQWIEFQVVKYWQWNNKNVCQMINAIENYLLINEDSNK